MAKPIDKYIEASGADPSIKGEFDSLVSKIGPLSDDEKQAAIQVKEGLDKLGFTYDINSFTAQDVLNNKGGNCLGLPLLVGSVMGESGFSPNFKIAVNPMDVTHDLEKSFLASVENEQSFRAPSFAEVQEEFPIYNFVPLEHLVLDVNKGDLVETTSKEHGFPKSESLRSLTFDNALSCVYKDRAAREVSEGNIVDGKKLLEKGLNHWEGNRQIYSFLASLAAQNFEDQTYSESIRKFRELGGEDSLFFFSNYLHNNSSADLNNAISRYPGYLPAVEASVRENVGRDLREAKFKLANLSKGYANSRILSLGSFYVRNSDLLGKLYGSDFALQKLEGVSDSQWGDFYFHTASYAQGGGESHLAEAAEAVESPLQQLEHSKVTKNTKFHDENLAKEMDRHFKGSRLYHNQKA